MNFKLSDFLTVTFTLFAVIDIIGTVPVLISMKSKMGAIREGTVTLIAGHVQPVDSPVRTRRRWRLHCYFYFGTGDGARP